MSAAGAVLRVTKVPVQTPVGNSYRGATLSWTLNSSCISVTGSCTATNLVDNLPGGVAVVDANGGSVAGSTITWNLGDLAGGTTASKTISVTVAMPSIRTPI